MRRNNVLSTWDRFKEDFHERFSGSTFDDRLQELSHIQKLMMVADYLDRFEELLNDVSGQLESSLISFFIEGLKSELRCELNIAKLTTPRKAFSLAKIFES